MQRNLIGATLIALFLTMASQAKAQTVLFDFRTNQGEGGVVGDPIPPNTNFDPGNAGDTCLLYTSPSPRDRTRSRMPSSA